MENFGKAMSVSAVPLLTALLQRNKYMCVSLTFKRHMTLYGTMVCFISLVRKSIALSYTFDSEHILEIAMCNKINSHHIKFFSCIKKDYIRDAHAT